MFNPFAWQPFGIVLVVEWRDLVFEYGVKRFTVFVILGVMVVRVLAITNGPTGVRILDFAPPTIRNRKVDATVDRDFHAGSAAGFVWAARVVKPDIHALDQHAGDTHVVVFDKDDVTT